MAVPQSGYQAHETVAGPVTNAGWNVCDVVQPNIHATMWRDRLPRESGNPELTNRKGETLFIDARHLGEATCISV